MIRTNIKNKILAIGLVTAMLTGCSFPNLSGNATNEVSEEINEEIVEETNEEINKETDEEILDDGIGPEDYIDEISEDNKYKEWADAVGLMESEHYHVISFYEREEDDGRIGFYVAISGLEDEDANEGMQDVAAVIEAHNEFVEEDPDYFSENTYIRIDLVEASEYTFMVFLTEFEGSMNNAELGFDLPNDHKFKYVSYRAHTYYPDYLDADVSISIPVIEMYNSWPETDFEDLNKILDMFVDVEAVVCYYSGDDSFDYDTFIELVTEKAPGAGAYRKNRTETVKLN